MQLSIIIVNYNVKFFLELCLLSAIKACKNIEAEIFVVDNNSSDGSEDYLSEKFPTVRFFWNKENVGFGKANNSVLKYTTGDHILFLNPDCIVAEDSFLNCVNFFKENSDCGAIGVKMIDGSGRFLKESKRSLPSPSSGLFKMLGLATLFPSSSFFSKYYAGHLPENENNKVHVLAGAFMMLSKKAIVATKGFDEDFFMYGEDIDLSYRLLKAGFQNYYLGTITIIHFKGESTQKKSNLYIKHFYGAIDLFVKKHYNSKSLLKWSMLSMVAVTTKIAHLKKKIGNGNNKIHNERYNIFFIGSGQQLAFIKNLLANTKHQITKQLLIEKDTTLENSILENNISGCNAILLCIDKITNKNIIDVLPKVDDRYAVFIYEANAQSIIGSNNKNERGIFISTAQ